MVSKRTKKPRTTVRNLATKAVPAGRAGKVKAGFSITKKIDKSSPKLLLAAYDNDNQK